MEYTVRCNCSNYSRVGHKLNHAVVVLNDSRFTIEVHIKQSPGVLTDIDAIETGSLEHTSVSVGEHGITLHGVPSDANVFVYDMTGKLLHMKLSTEERMQLHVPQGVYNIRVQTPSGSKTLRAIVR